ncbi:hypothetical protein FLL45_22210 [Aliikangiella marina]|uniref:Calcineurin-like phosphoesterase domain-containing protein n=1 Tax=Aliikangiella marina TaxID=1712262 RepID=A0A545T1F4_9GAMM|nr:metallophosphoesterase [Aliikangiella marina]TQV71043.1 hypothetical protein FLL45_22210 [Aliikangiella marina]
MLISLNRWLLAFLVSAVLITLKPVSNLALAAEVHTSETVWAFADSHGDYQELTKLLKTAEIIDEDNNWRAGKSILVSTGDVLDRGPGPRKIFDLLIKLEQQATEAGGKLLFSLGNHEVMILVGDLRYVAPAEYAEFEEDETEALRDQYFERFVNYHQTKLRKEQKNSRLKIDKKKVRIKFDEAFPKGYFARYEAFSPQGKYGKWLLNKDFINKVNDRLFTHGGLSPELVGKTLNEVNAQLKGELLTYVNAWHDLLSDGSLTHGIPFRQRAKSIINQKEEFVTQFNSQENAFLFSTQSPTWYRGAIYCHPFYENESLRNILASFDAKQVLLGHSVTPTRRVNQRLNNQAILMDTGMLGDVYGGSGNIIQIIDDKLSVLNSSGEVYQPETAYHTAINYPTNLSHDELVKLLETKEADKTEKLKTGITRPSRLTFNVNGNKIRALSKYIDDSPNLQNERKRKPEDMYADRYHNDIAAYRLSELMGFKLVPISTTRPMDEGRGLVQYWVENSYTEYEANEKGWAYDGHCSYEAQMNMMRVFDLLIHNFDRNPTNILIEENQGQLVWIDHSRSFSFRRKLPREIDRSNIKLTPEVRKALTELTKDKVKKSMGDLLNRNQINALMKRRDLILNLDPLDD